MREELDKWFPAVSNFALQETFGTIWRYFVLSHLEGEFAIVTSWVRAVMILHIPEKKNNPA